MEWTVTFQSDPLEDPEGWEEAQDAAMDFLTTTPPDGVLGGVVGYGHIGAIGLTFDVEAGAVGGAAFVGEKAFLAAGNAAGVRVGIHKAEIEPSESFKADVVEGVPV